MLCHFVSCIALNTRYENQAAVQAALERYIAATNTHEFSAVQPCLHPDAIYWFSDQRCQSLPEIQAYFEAAWQMVVNEVYSIDHIQWLAIDAHSASCIYHYYSGFVDGQYVQGGGRASNLFVYVQGKWLLKHEDLSPHPAS